MSSIDYYDRNGAAFFANSVDADMSADRARFLARLPRLAQALRPGGVFYMSFKYGPSDRFVHGRYFNDMTEDRLTAALAPSALRIAEMWTSHDVRSERAGERWLSVLAIC